MARRTPCRRIAYEPRRRAERLGRANTVPKCGQAVASPTEALGRADRPSDLRSAAQVEIDTEDTNAAKRQTSAPRRPTPRRSQSPTNSRGDRWKERDAIDSPDGIWLLAILLPCPPPLGRSLYAIRHRTVVSLVSAWLCDRACARARHGRVGGTPGGRRPPGEGAGVLHTTPSFLRATRNWVVLFHLGYHPHFFCCCTKRPGRPEVTGQKLLVSPGGRGF